MSNAFLGQISMFAGNFAPRNWAFCNGQLLNISQYTALFSLLGTYYGGNGSTNFALPDLRSRVPVHEGQGLGLSPYAIGQNGGAADVTITLAELPQHIHALNGSQTPATAAVIGTGVVPGTPTAGTTPEFYANPVSGQPALTMYNMDPRTCTPAGGNQPHTNLMPSLCITFIIALSGIYPSRN